MRTGDTVEAHGVDLLQGGGAAEQGLAEVPSRVVPSKDTAKEVMRYASGQRALRYWASFRNPWSLGSVSRRKCLTPCSKNRSAWRQ